MQTPKLDEIMFDQAIKKIKKKKIIQEKEGIYFSLPN